MISYLLVPAWSASQWPQPLAVWANKPHPIIHVFKKALDGPAMRPTTPQVTENSVGERSTLKIGAK